MKNADEIIIILHVLLTKLNTSVAFRQPHSNVLMKKNNVEEIKHEWQKTIFAQTHSSLKCFQIDI